MMKKQYGFNLVEIIIIVVVIGIIAALAAPKMFNLHDKSFEKIVISTAKVYKNAVNAAKSQWLMESEPSEGIHYAKSYNLSLNCDPVTKWPNAASINKRTHVSNNASATRDDGIDFSQGKHTHSGQVDVLGLPDRNVMQNPTCENLMKVFMNNASVETALVHGKPNCHLGKDWCAFEVNTIDGWQNVNFLTSRLPSVGNICLYLFRKDKSTTHLYFTYSSKTGEVLVSSRKLSKEERAKKTYDERDEKM